MGQISGKGKYIRDEGCTQSPRSVFAGQKHCSRRSVGLRDYPKGLTSVDAITTHQTVSVFEAQFIFSLVFQTEIAPVAAKVAREEFERGLLGLLQHSKRGGRGNDLAGRKQRDRRKRIHIRHSRLVGSSKSGGAVVSTRAPHALLPSLPGGELVEAHCLVFRLKDGIGQTMKGGWALQQPPLRSPTERLQCSIPLLMRRAIAITEILAGTGAVAQENVTDGSLTAERLLGAMWSEVGFRRRAGSFQFDS